METAQIVAKIAQETGKTEQEINELIKKKTDKFSGLLTENSAAYIVAKDHNVEIEGMADGKTATISQLENGMSAVDINVQIKRIFPLQKFEKGNKKGVVSSLIVADSTGEIRLTLWNDEAKKIDSEKLERGAELQLSNCYVSEWKDKKQLNLGHNGKMKIIKNPKKHFPGIENKIYKLSELSESMSDVDVYCRFNRAFEPREFQSAERKGSVMNFEISDDSGMARATAWNDMVDVAKGLEQGDTIKIEGAYTKAGMKGIELHLGWQSRILKNPEGVEIKQVMPRQFASKRVPLNQIADNGELIETRAKIVDLLGTKISYEVCPKCGKSIQKLDEGKICANCGEIKKTDIKMLASVAIDDGTAVIRAVAFDKIAEELLEITKEKYKKELSDKQPEDIFDMIKQNIYGKEFIFNAQPKTNARSSELELIIRSVRKVDEKSEIDELIGSNWP